MSTLTAEKAPRRLYAIMALALIGIALSVILTLHFYEVHSGMASFKSLCRVGEKFNCDAVAASSFSELFLGIPLSSFATGWYVAIFAVSLFGLSANWRREAIRALTLMTGFSVLMTLGYLYVMFALLHTYCLYCFGVDVVNVLLFGLVLTLKPEKFSEAPLNTGEWKGLLATIAGCVFVSVVALHGLDQANFRQEDVNLLVQEAMNKAPVSVGTGSLYPSFGPANAPVTIVEFSDFECPYCRIGATTMNTILHRYPDKVRVVFRNYPLDMACNRNVQHPMHQASCEAARVGYCVSQQGKFEPYYEEVFENQKSLVPGKPMEIAKSVGVDEAKLKECLASPESQLAIQKDIEEGTSLGIMSTPTFFINGRKVEGVLPIPALNQIIDQLTAGTGK